MKKTIIGIAFAAAAACGCIAADAPAPSIHELIDRQIKALQAKPEKMKLAPYLAPEKDFEDACREAAKGGKLILVSIGREACGRCQVFYEFLRRGEVKLDPAKFSLVRLEIDDSSHRSYFFSTFTPPDNNLPFVGVMNGDRDALSPCLSGGHTPAEYQTMLKRAAAKTTSR